MNMDFQALVDAAGVAWESGDFDGCAACQLQMLEMIQAHPEILPEADTTYLQQDYMMRIIAAALFAFERGDERLAYYYLSHFPQNVLEEPGCFPEYGGTLGFFAYRTENFVRARELLEAHLGKYPQDEMAWFHLGNTWYRMGKYQRAVAAYQEALYQKAGLQEARTNQKQALDAMMQPASDCVPAPCEASWELGVDAEDWEAVRRLPIFINCRDRVECLRKLVQWLLKAGYQNLVLLDNASTYEPLLDYYEKIRSEHVRIVRFDDNLGHKAVWESGILEHLSIETPYVYTDPDVLPTEHCPPKFLQEFVRVLATHPMIRKVGADLRVSDIAAPHRERVQKSKPNFCRVPLHIGEDVSYFANVDTTFALYRNVRFYHRGPSIRMAGRYEFLHLPWYYEAGHIPKDEQYYFNHAINVSTTKYFMEHPEKS